MNRVEFVNCRMTGIDLADSYIKNMYWCECKADYSSLRFASVDSAILEQCILVNCELPRAKLKNVIFNSCDLRRAELSGVAIENVDVRTTDIEGIRIAVKDMKGLTVDMHQALYLASWLGLDIR